MKIKKIISGGQTGADMAGLLAAKELGLETGGCMPLGFRTEKGNRPEYRDRYGMVEHASAAYPPRTEWNVLNSDGTVVFGYPSGGSQLTISLCNRLQKPWLHNPDRRMFTAWLRENRIQTLNVAGNRESVNPGIEVWVYDFLIEALS